jgi:hypothetical protein
MLMVDSVREHGITGIFIAFCSNLFAGNGACRLLGLSSAPLPDTALGVAVSGPPVLLQLLPLLLFLVLFLVPGTSVLPEPGVIPWTAVRKENC